MAGFKFGASHVPDYTWAMNCYLPALACRRYGGSRIAAFSTGNIYGLTSTSGHGSREEDSPQPIGEYAMSALGRERMFEYFSRRNETPISILRLNYATELRYGVLVDIAQQVQAGEPIDLRMGMVNVIWLRDANAMALCSLAAATSPAKVINIAGLEMLRVRDVAEQFGLLFGRPPQLVNHEGPQALLSDGRQGDALLGPQETSAQQMIEWTAAWLSADGPRLGKPTHFDVLDGHF
jgi:nucleoside-diphosphate-sugar epimerase